MKPIATVITTMPAAWRRNAVAVRGPETLEQAQEILAQAPSEPLLRAVQEAERCADLRAAGHTGFGTRVSVKQATADEAQRRLLALQVKFRRAPDEIAEAWLRQLDSACERAPNAPARDQAIADLMGLLDLPVCCYTRASLKAVASSPDGKSVWFPGYGRLVHALEPFEAALRRSVRLLRDVVDGVQQPQQAFSGE